MSHDNKTSHVFLHPGEYVIGTSACTIHTLLGSCVSIVLWHPDRRIGAMSHFIVPSRAGESEFPLSGRYGDEVLTLMLLELEQIGIEPRDCVASIYGGSNVILPLQGQSQNPSIGMKNGETAKQQLAALGIPVVAESLFGNGYRKIEFDIASGEVTTRLMEAANDCSPDAVNCIGSHPA